jgi:hypothetical protein
MIRFEYRDLIKIFLNEAEQIGFNGYLKFLQKANKTSAIHSGIFLTQIDKDLYEVKGFTSGIFKAQEHVGLRIREMVKGAMLLKLGPLPPVDGTPHEMRLIVSPYLLVKSFLKVKSIYKDWAGTTYFEDIPYCTFR